MGIAQQTGQGYLVNPNAAGATLPFIFADTPTLEANYPASRNLGVFAWTGANAPFTQVVSNGTAWIANGGAGSIGAAALAALLQTLPTTLPAQPGVAWLNGGLLAIS